MSSKIMRDTADVLEKMAAFVDQTAQTQQNTLQEERLRIATDLREKIATATGEDIPDEVLAKIASADAGVVDAFTKLAAQRYDEPPEAMGEARNLGEDYSAVPLTKTAQQTETTAQQSQAFVDWVMS